MPASLTGASLDSGNSKNTSAQVSNERGLTFSEDGTKMYVSNRSNGFMYQYTLSTPWDLTTAAYASKSLNVGTQDTNPMGMDWKPDGSVLFVAGDVNDTIYQYTVATPWDLSTATYASKSKNVGAQTAGFTCGARLKSDGTKLFALSLFSTVYEYPLSTPWDLSTAGAVTSALILGPLPGNSTTGFDFSSDGLRVFSVDSVAAEVRQHNLPTAWTLAGASSGYSAHLDISATSTTPGCLAVAADDSKLFAGDFTAATIYRWSLGTDSTRGWVVGSVSFV